MATKLRVLAFDSFRQRQQTLAIPGVHPATINKVGPTGALHRERDKKRKYMKLFDANVAARAQKSKIPLCLNDFRWLRIQTCFFDDNEICVPEAPWGHLGNAQLIIKKQIFLDTQMIVVGFSLVLKFVGAPETDGNQNGFPGLALQGYQSGWGGRLECFG